MENAVALIPDMEVSNGRGDKEHGNIEELERQLTENLTITESQNVVAKRGKLPLGILNTIEDLGDDILENNLPSANVDHLMSMNKLYETLLQQKEDETEQFKETIEKDKETIEKLQQTIDTLKKEKSEVAVYAEKKTVETVTMIQTVSKVSKQDVQIEETSTRAIDYNNSKFEEMEKTVSNQEQLLIQMKAALDEKSLEMSRLIETFEAENTEKSILISNFEAAKQENAELRNTLAQWQLKVQSYEQQLAVAERKDHLFQAKCEEICFKTEEIAKLKIELQNQQKFGEETFKANFHSKCEEILFKTEEIAELKIELEKQEKLSEETFKANIHLQKSNQEKRAELAIMMGNIKKISTEKIELLKKISNLKASKLESDSCLTLSKNQLLENQCAIVKLGEKLQLIETDLKELIQKCMNGNIVRLNDLRPIYRHFNESRFGNDNDFNLDNSNGPIEMTEANHQRTDASLSDNDSIVEVFDSRHQKSPDRSGRSKSHRNSSSGSSSRGSSCSRSLSRRRSSCRRRSTSRGRSLSRDKSPSRRSSSSRGQSSSRGRSLSRRKSSSRGRSLSRRRSSSRGRSLSRRRSCSRRSSSSPHKLERDELVSSKRRRRSDNRAGNHFNKRNRSFSRRKSRHDSNSPERKYINNRRSRSRMRDRSKSNTRTKSRDNYDESRREKSYSGKSSESSSTRLRSEPDTSTTNSHAPLLPPPSFKFEPPAELFGSLFDINNSSNELPIKLFNPNNSSDQDHLTRLSNVVSSKNGNLVSATMKRAGAIPLVLNVGNSAASTDEVSPNSLIQKYTISVQKNIPGYHHGNHPIKELDEQCVRRGWRYPRYAWVLKHGEYFYRVKVNGEWYHPEEGCTSARDSQMRAAMYCLQQLGVYPV